MVNALTRSLAGSHFLQEQSLTPFQAQASQLMGSFMHEASQWKTLSAMMLGALSSKLLQSGLLSCTVNYAKLPSSLAFFKTASLALGLGAEVSVYRGSLSLLGDLPSSSVFSKDWIRDYLNFGILKGFGKIAEGENLVFTHCFQSSGMVLGQNLSASLEIAPAPTGNLFEQFFHAEIINLQMGAGMSLGHFLTGHRLLAWEKGFDLSIHSIQETLSLPSEPPFPILKPVGVESGKALTNVTGPRSFRQAPLLQVSLYDAEVSSTESLIARFRRLSTSHGNSAYGERILADALATPLPPRLQERLLESYTHLREVGSQEQAYTARAIQSIFRLNALRSPSGTFKQALLQYALEHSLADPEAPSRQVKMQTLFRLMEGALPDTALENFVREVGERESLELNDRPLYSSEFWALHAEEIARSWMGYQSPDMLRMLNLIYELAPQDGALASRWIQIIGQARSSGRYSPSDIDAALARARENPFGQLMLWRILQVFAVEEEGSKLKELSGLSSFLDFPINIRQAIELGEAPELIARRINATTHTAFINDLRLARKFVVFALDTEERSRYPLKQEAFKYAFDAAFFELIRSTPTIQVEHLMKLVNLHSSGQTRLFERQWREEEFEIEMLSAEEFDALLSRWGMVSDCENTLFEARGPLQKDRIILRALPDFDLSTELGVQQAYMEILTRVIGLIHEWEHWRHFSGNYSGIETGSEPIAWGSLGRKERIISEVMAYLEEQRFRARGIDADLWEISRRMGIGPVAYLRNQAEMSYFGEVNQRLLAGLHVSSLP